jgi:type I restriction enzyme S subunit
VELLEEEKKAIVYDECKEYFKTHRKKVKFVVRICNGLEQKSVEDINGQYPIYGSGGIIGYANKFLHNKTSVLLGRKGTIDKPIYVTEPFWSIDTAFYTIINERKIIPKYFFFATSFINFDEYKYGSAIPSMTQGMLNNIEIPLPNLDKQKELVEVIEVQLEKLNLAISKAQKEISAIKEYREALITDLVTGKRSVPQL